MTLEDRDTLLKLTEQLYSIVAVCSSEDFSEWSLQIRAGVIWLVLDVSREVREVARKLAA